MPASFANLGFLKDAPLWPSRSAIFRCLPTPTGSRFGTTRRAMTPLNRFPSQPAFFGDAADMLACGDMVMISAADGARLLCVRLDTDSLPQLTRLE
jgi:hypothetical protein